MALSTHAKEMWPAQAMRHSPYTIPPRLSAMHHRSPYNSCFHPPPSANVSPSAFFQTSMLSSATGCNFTGATAYPPTPLSNGYTSQIHVSTSVLQSPVRSHSTSSCSGSPIQPNSPDLDEPLSDETLKHCGAYPPLHNGGQSSPLSYLGSQSSPLPLTHSQSMLPSPMYTPQDYTSSGSHCLPSLPVWNYPTLPMNPLPPNSLPKLSYDSPRYKLTPERAIALIKWFEEHKDHPYPTRHEKILLCQSTQLTFTQVSTWFANARRRMKKASSEEVEERSNSDDSSSQNGEESPSNFDEHCEESRNHYCL